jgi:multicomponent Na+:H+ antiporter subunit F
MLALNQPDTFVSVVVYIVLAILGLAVVLAFVRLVLGPSIPDRVVALDLIATVVVGLCGVYSIAAAEPMFLRVSTVLALIAFLGTVAFAYFVQEGGAP